jgi:hypothetical protein
LARDNINIEQFIVELEQQARLSYRLMLRRVDTTWTLQAMMADMDSKLESRFVYDYGEVAFIGGVGKGAPRLLVEMP